MPQRRTAVKKLRKDKKRYIHNLKIKNQVKKIIKSFKKLVAEKKFEEAKGLFPKVCSSLDKASKKHIIKPQTGHRKISRLHLLLNKIQK